MIVAIPIRDDTPVRSVPVVTAAIVAACAGVFVWQAGLSGYAARQVTIAYGMIPSVLFGRTGLPPGWATLPAWSTLFTSMFLHGGWLHLGGNMLYLWLFGKGVEGAIGPVRFLLLYLSCGVIAALVQAGIDPGSTVPMIGASGAIAGILGAYFLLYPRANIVVFVWFIIIVRLITVPAVILLGLWFALQLTSGLATPPNAPGVAFWAHVGGFVAGLGLVIAAFRPRRVPLFQSRNSAAFTISRPRRGRWRGASVPPSGRR